MSKKSKVLKYKVVNTNIDKKFIGKNLDLERVKAKGGHAGGRNHEVPIRLLYLNFLIKLII